MFTIFGYEFPHWSVFFFYVLPTLMCVPFYTWEIVSNFVSDRRARETPSHYYLPTDTIGDVLGRMVAMVCPVINLFAAICFVTPAVFEATMNKLSVFFNQQLVPDDDHYRELRKLKGGSNQ